MVTRICQNVLAKTYYVIEIITIEKTVLQVSNVQDYFKVIMYTVTSQLIICNC